MERVNLTFKYLPAYAKYLLENKLHEYAVEQLRLARAIDFPLLRFFTTFTDEQLLELSKADLPKFFQFLIENRAADQILDGLHQWKNNMLPLIDKEQVVAEDITLSVFLRKAMFTHYLPDYTSDLQLCLNIIREMDEFNTANELASFKMFSNIQHEKIEQGIAQLQESDKLYKQSQALTHIGNWTWTIADNKVKWSDELYRIYGLQPQAEEITFERFLSLVHPDDRQGRIEQIQESVKTHKAPNYTMRIVTDSGELKILQGKNEVLVENGEAVKIAGTCQDITHEYWLSKQLENERNSLDEANQILEQKNRELERSNKELTSFSYVASHDLQEPLRKIKTFNSLIIQREGASLPDNVKELLAKVDVSVSRMQTLIRDLLSFSRAHSDLHKFETADLQQIVNDVYATFSDNATVSVKVNAENLPKVSAIPFQLTQLFSNLISNSVKYAKGSAANITITANKVAGKQVDIQGANPKESYYHIAIADDGIGFNPEYTDKIFEIFQRLHNRDEYSGTGIGLAICKRIVQNHNGFISADSKEGEGATFNIYLPVQQG